MSYEVYNEDFRDRVKLLEDESIDLILTDIPYGISIKKNGISKMGNRNGLYFGDWDSDFDVQDLEVLVPKLKKGGSLVTFCAFEQYHEIIDVLHDLEIKDRFIWQKNNPMPRNVDRRYVSNIEFGCWLVKGGQKWTFNKYNSTYDTCVMTYPSESGTYGQRYHPCQKNVVLMQELVLRHSNEGDLIFDPFAGSGSTIIAAEKQGRNSIGTERDPKNFEVLQERLRTELIY